MKNLLERLQDFYKENLKREPVEFAAEVALCDKAFPGEEFNEELKPWETKSGRPEVFTATAEETAEYFGESGAKNNKMKAKED